MNKVSKINLDMAVKKIMASEMGVLLLESDEKSIFDLLAEKSTYKDRQGIFGNGFHITCHLYPLMYKKRDIKITQDLLNIRGSAIYNLFARWDALGHNKRHAKDPFKSNAFQKYLEQIEFLSADYMLLMVN